MTTDKTNVLSNEEWKPSASPWIISIAVMLSTFMVVLDTSVANVALPHMAGSFSASSNEIMWVLTSYLIATGIILPSTAWFSSIFGRKNLLMICIVLFTFASILCGVAHSLDFMILARVLQGLGGGALMPISQAILLESFPKEQRGTSMAVFGLGVVLAPVIGPTLGGWITDNFSWNWIFFINIPIGILAVVMTHIYVEDPPYIERGKIQRIDFIGFSALIIWLVSLQIILDNGQKSDWFESQWVCNTALLSISAMILFFVWEFKFKDSIVDLSVFKDRNFSVGTMLSMLVNAILYSTLAILPLFLQTLLGYTAYHSGMAITPRGVGCLATIGLAGYLANKLDNRLLIAFGFLLLAISCFIFGNLNLTISMGNIIFPNIICGMALGFIFIPLATMSFGTLSNEQMTNATGIQNLLKSIGGGIGVSIVGTMLQRMSQIHQANMVGHLNPLDPVFQMKVETLKYQLSIYMNPVVADQKANYLMYASLLKQSALWSYIHNFRLYGILCVILIPTAFLFKKVSHHNDSSGSVLH